MKRPTPGSRKLVAVTALGLAALITLAASARPDSAYAVPALPGAEVSDADLRILTEAAEVVQKSNQTLERRMNSRQRGRAVRKAITASEE